MRTLMHAIQRWSEVVAFPSLWWKARHVHHKIVSYKDNQSVVVECDVCEYKKWRKERANKRLTTKVTPALCPAEVIVPTAIVITKPSWLQRLLDS